MRVCLHRSYYHFCVTISLKRPHLEFKSSLPAKRWRICAAAMLDATNRLSEFESLSFGINTLDYGCRDFCYHEADNRQDHCNVAIRVLSAVQSCTSHQSSLC